MEDISLLRNQPRENPWGWAFCGTLITHIGVVCILALYASSPMSSMSLPKAIKIDLISMPAAPKVQKTRVAPQPIIQKVVVAPPVQKTVVAPPVHKPKPVVKKQPKPLPTPAIALKPEVVPVPQPVVTPAPEPERPIVTAYELSEDLQVTTAEVPPVQTISNPGNGSEQVATTEAGDNVLENYSYLLREQINKVKRYPLMARRAGKQGMVVVEFKINREGKLLDSQVVNGCGTRALDKAALKALQRATPFAKLPDNLNSPHSFTVQINFSLDG